MVAVCARLLGELGTAVAEGRTPGGTPLVVEDLRAEAAAGMGDAP